MASSYPEEVHAHTVQAFASMCEEALAEIQARCQAKAFDLTPASYREQAIADGIEFARLAEFCKERLLLLSAIGVVCLEDLHRRKTLLEQLSLVASPN